jgi:1-acyl-sn-glycerol-3-phosphate acyltransferase
MTVVPTSSDHLPADLAATEGQLLALVDAVASELHRGHTGLRSARLDTSLERELAIDSLARVELGIRIERSFGHRIADERLFEAETPRDLLLALASAQGVTQLESAQRSAQPPQAASAVTAPEHANTLVEMLAWHAENHGQRQHVQFFEDGGNGEVLSYRALWDGAARVAAGLQHRGLEVGARVALMLPTGSDYFFAFCGVLLAGGVPVPIYPPVRRAQLEDHLRRQGRILANCQAAALITTDDALLVARLLTAAVASLGIVTTVQELSAHGTQFERAAPVGEDLAFLQYTSGSTGDPKGVMLSHTNVLANIRADGQGLAVTPDDVFVSWLPLYHDMGLIGAWLGSLYHAVPLVLMSPLSFLARPQRWLWAIHRHRGTLSAAPNFAYELCVSRIADSDVEGLDLSSWRLTLNGAEAISPQTMAAFSRRYAAYGLRREAMLPVYGLAECAVGLTFTPLGRGAHVEVIDRERLAREGRAEIAPAGLPDEATRSIVACGVPLARHEIRVVDDARRELPERHEGNVQFRGPSATRGYWGNSAETARLVGADGWLNSGDRGYLVGGELYLTGRVKDIIIRAGRNIYPAELEDAIGALDGIRKGHVAVFGSPDPGSGTERVVVLAETRKRTPESRAALETAIKELAADLIATPPEVVVLAPPNTVLRTSSGKVRRSACRALYEQGLIGAGAPPVWMQIARLTLAGIGPQLSRAWRNARAWLYSSYAWGVFVPLALAAWLVAALPLPRGWVWRGARGLARLLAMLTATPLRDTAWHELPAAGQAAVLVVNHQSYLDGMLMLAVLPRPPRFLIKAELRDSVALGRPLARLGALFVDRFDAAGGIASMRVAAAALADGELLVIFPEGTFKRMPGVLPFHMGAFTIAAQAQVPLLPVAVRGTRAILRSGSWFIRHGRIELSAGRALMPGREGEVWQQALALRDAARAHILAHCGEPDLAHESNAVSAD